MKNLEIHNKSKIVGWISFTEAEIRRITVQVESLQKCEGNLSHPQTGHTGTYNSSYAGDLGRRVMV
jgi:hypothetical protein